jgi:hypothetical protein
MLIGVYACGTYKGLAALAGKGDPHALKLLLERVNPDFSKGELRKHRDHYLRLLADVLRPIISQRKIAKDGTVATLIVRILAGKNPELLDGEIATYVGFVRRFAQKRTLSQKTILRAIKTDKITVEMSEEKSVPSRNEHTTEEKRKRSLQSPRRSTANAHHGVGQEARKLRAASKTRKSAGA